MPDNTPCVACDAVIPVRPGERVVRCPDCGTRNGVVDDDTPIRSRTTRKGVPVHIVASVGLIVFLAAGVGVIVWFKLAGGGDGNEPQARVTPTLRQTAPTRATTAPKTVTKPTRPQTRPPIELPRPAAEPPRLPSPPPVESEPKVTWGEPKPASTPVRLRPEWMEANEANVAEALKRLEERPAAVTYPMPASRPPKPDQSGYLKRTASGFTLFVSEECHDQSDKRDGQPIACLEDELQAIAARLPEALVKQLAKVPVWVEWDHTVPGMPDVLAVYHHATSRASLALTGVDPRKNRCVTVMTLRTVYAAKSRDKLPTNVLAHELAHAVHDQVLGLDNPVVRNAYQQVVTRRLYTDVRHADGQSGPGYAITSEAEYFAELSACYLDRIRYAPTDATGLREYDSPGYELMTKVWGTEKAIEAAKKKDAERKAKQQKPPAARGDK